jgi:GNAT superfamily N-acetyltransferase
MIRDAVKEDVPELVELGRQMHAEASRLNKLRYVPGKVFVQLSSMIGADHCFVRVVEEDGRLVGGLVAAVEPHWFSTDLLAYDMALFMRPDKRGGLAAAQLAKQYTEWAKERGAVVIQMGISTGVRLEATSALLERVGFKPAGFLFDAG